MVIKAQNLFLEFRAKHLKNTIVPDWMLQKKTKFTKISKNSSKRMFYKIGNTFPSECSQKVDRTALSQRMRKNKSSVVQSQLSKAQINMNTFFFQ